MSNAAGGARLNVKTDMLKLFLPAFLLALAAQPVRADSPEDLFRQGHFFGELRYRYENVEQDGVAKTAQANTLRADLGFETGLYKDFTALADFQTVRHLDDNFNDLENGKITYPVIADPDRNQFRQAWLMWTGLPNTTIRGGRQEVIFDNQRFVGNGDFRQNDQTFDAALAAWSPLSDLTLNYVYLWNINRVAGPDYTGNTHLLHASYEYADWLRLAGYGYFIDINQKPAQSSETFGLQATGAKAVTGDIEIDYLAEFARQSDYRNNPDNYNAHYFHATPSLLWKGLTLQAGFESLSGNGTDAFQTPLATLHAFNGWADMFLTTPVNGLDDRYGRVSYRISGPDWIDDTTLSALYHDFSAQRTSADYGHEWDFQAMRSFETRDFLTKEWTLSAKYAAYKADTLFTDTNKFWLMAGTKF